MSTFEERLLSALKQEIPARTAEDHVIVQRPARRVAGLAAAVAGAAAAVILGLTLVNGGAPAYAVTTDPDGTVKVHVKELSDADGLEAELAKVGIKAVVDYLPADQTCKEPRGHVAPAPGGKMTTATRKDGDGVTFEITKGQVASDQTLVLAISGGVGGAFSAQSMHVITGAVAACEATALPEPTGKPDDAGGPGPTDHTEVGSGQHVEND